MIQTLFAWSKDSDKTMLTARKELRKSFADTYDLYFILLDFVNELTSYAQKQLEEQQARARATHSDWKPNKRFVQNRLAQQIFDNRAVRARVTEQQLAWDSGMTAVIETYRLLTESDFYREYMAADSCTYEDDKRVWRLIFQHLLLNSDVLHEALEDMELALDKSNWSVDTEIIISYVVKTLKRFTAESTPETPVLEMFDSNDEGEFGEQLLLKAIELHAQNEQLINTHLKGWDADRIADMDRVIIETALTEILSFEEIPLTISLNEYIELAKDYSGDKSYMFINGILTEILRDLKNEGKFFKGFAIK